MPPPLVHWDDVEGRRADLGHLGARWSDLGEAAGTRRVGLKRIEIDADRWSTPLHRQTAEEEIFFVLAGSGTSLQRRREDAACEVRAGDCLVHRAGGEYHTLRAGPEGLEVLAFGTRSRTEIGHLPRAGVAFLARTWVDVGGGEHPWEREVAAGEPELPEPTERPPNVVNLDDVEAKVWAIGDDMGGATRGLAERAGSELTGLNYEEIPPGKLNTDPHCHSAEEEIFVMLDGEGTLLLGEEEHGVRRGHLLSRPPGTGVVHAFRAGDGGLTLLSYGTREPNDMAYYPRTGLIALRGLGLLGRLQPARPDDEKS
jgi:uncharacterized cupin superfamily protein